MQYWLEVGHLQPAGSQLSAQDRCHLTPTMAVARSAAQVLPGRWLPYGPVMAHGSSKLPCLTSPSFRSPYWVGGACSSGKGQAEICAIERRPQEHVQTVDLPAVLCGDSGRTAPDGPTGSEAGSGNSTAAHSYSRTLSGPGGETEAKGGGTEVGDEQPNGQAEDGRLPCAHREGPNAELAVALHVGHVLDKGNHPVKGPRARTWPSISPEYGMHICAHGPKGGRNGRDAHGSLHTPVHAFRCMHSGVHA